MSILTRPAFRVSRCCMLPTFSAPKMSPFINLSSRRFCSQQSTSPEKQQTLTSKISSFVLWLRTTAKEKGKPFLAWYVFLYFGGLVGAYGIVRWYGKVEPELVREWALKLKVDKIVDVDSIELTKQNCEYFAALLLNESVDTPRLILAVLTIDRVILLGRRIIRR